MEDYEILFETAKVEQLKQMVENGHKRGWGKLPLGDAYHGIEHNVKKLPFVVSDKVAKEETIRRLANIANFAAMGIMTLKKKEL